MLDLKFLRGNLDLVRQSLTNRNSDVDVDEFVRLDERRRAALAEVERLKGERNQASAEVAKLKRAGGDASELIARTSGLGDRIKGLDEEAKGVDAEVQAWLMAVPNVPDSSVPVGRDERDNAEVRTWGEPPAFDFPPREHWEIGAIQSARPGRVGGLDFERAAKLTGSRFAVSWGWAARLERALVQFMLDVQTTEHGYTEILPPFMVNSASLLGTGQLPKFAGDLFKLEGWDYWLIPTAEVPLTNLHRDEVLDEADLPLAYAAHTPCFRSEAGSYGKDTKGLIRQHQFNKVEMVRFAHPEQSFENLELMTGHAEAILQKLGLPYRTIVLCTGDMGFGSAKTYDIEVWLPGQSKYREISSCSNMTDFQARRANIRFKPKSSNKSQLVHTLNGSGLAVGRTLVAVLENYQQADGSIAVPQALRPYMGGIERIETR